MKMRSLALALGILSYGALAQAQRWVVPPHVIDVTGAQPVVAALPGNPPLPYRVANGVVDQSGNVQFYVVAGASSSLRLFDGSGAPFGSLFAETLSHQIAIVPDPASCGRYFLLYFHSRPFIGLDLYASVVDAAKGQVVKTTLLENYSDNRGALAVGRLRGDGTRFVYVVAQRQVDRLRITAAGIALDNAIATGPGIDNFVIQAALSPDGKRLAFGGDTSGIVTVIALDDVLGATAIATYPFGPAAGVAFSPDGKKLFVSPPAFPAPQPIAMIDLLSGTMTSLSAASTPYAGSLLQLAPNGNIYVAGPNDLGAIVNPNAASPSFVAGAVPGVVSGTLANSQTGGSRTLPLQIDGEPQVACHAPCGNPALVQSTYGVAGNFELVTPYPGGGIAHYWRNNDLVTPVWNGPYIFATDVGAVDAVSMIQSSYGNLEVVARIGDRLAHFYRDFNGVWNGPTYFASGASGTPAFIEGPFGSPVGNFEVVTPLAAGGMRHYWRDNIPNHGAWNASIPFAQGFGTVTDVSLSRNKTGQDLELVARVQNNLLHFFRSGATWSGATALFAPGASGAHSFVQGRFGTPGNFELVTPLGSGGLAHYGRDPAASFSWFKTAGFGAGTATSVSLIQSNYGNNLEVVTRQDDCSLLHYWRGSTGSLPWSTPGFRIWP